MEVAAVLIYSIALLGGFFHLIAWTVLDVEDRKAVYDFLTYRVGYLFLSTVLPEIVKLSVIGALLIEGDFSSTVKKMSRGMDFETAYFRYTEFFRNRNSRLASGLPLTEK